jgi:hypothetical protein
MIMRRGVLLAVLLVGIGCGESSPYPAELEGSHVVDGFCAYTIDGRHEVLRPFSPRVRLFPVPEDVEDCADFMLSTPELSPESCGRATSTGPIWRAEITAADNADLGVFPSFSSYDRDLGTWNLSEDVTYSGTLTYDTIERHLTFEVNGAGVADSFSTEQGRGMVHCLFEGTVEIE